METVDLATRLTLVLIVLSDWVVGADWQFKMPLRLLAVAGLLVPGLHRSKTLWCLLAAVMSLKTLFHWWAQDNHVFLLTYWFLAVALALRLEEPSKPLATSGRLLIGLSFAFAVLWKGPLSPDFLDGTYFHYTFLTDSRFGDFAHLLGGVGDELSRANHAAMRELGSIRQNSESIQLQSTTQVVWLAHLVTWWTIFIEGAAAVTFLWPYGRGLSKARHATLLFFAYTTYMAATVETFGLTLLTLGLAQCEPELRRTRLLYIGGCFLVLLYDYVPLLSFLRPLVPN
jgi:hypothetical protein